MSTTESPNVHQNLTIQQACHNFVYDDDQIQQVQDIFMSSSSVIDPVFGLSMNYRRTKVEASERVCDDAQMSKHFIVDTKSALAQQIRHHTVRPVEYTFHTACVPTHHLALYFHPNHASLAQCTLQQMESGLHSALQLLKTVAHAKPVDFQELKMCQLMSTLDRQHNPWFHFEVDVKPFAEMKEVCGFIPGQLVVIETRHGFHFLFPKTTMSAHKALHRELDQRYLKNKTYTVVKGNQFPIPGTYQNGFPVRFYLVRPE